VSKAARSGLFLASSVLLVGLSSVGWGESLIPIGKGVSTGQQKQWTTSDTLRLQSGLVAPALDVSLASSVTTNTLVGAARFGGQPSVSLTGSGNQIKLNTEGTAPGTIVVPNFASARTQTLQDASGTFAFLSDIPAFAGFADPTGEVDGTVVDGVAVTAMRSDAAPPLADPFTPADGTQNITGALQTSDIITADNGFYSGIYDVLSGGNMIWQSSGSSLTLRGQPFSTSRTVTWPDLSGLVSVIPSTVAANTFYAGPTGGGATAPSFRAISTSDLPAGTGTVLSFTLRASSGTPYTSSTYPDVTIVGAGISSTAIAGSTVTVTSTEADTLATVTGRGAATATDSTFGSTTPTGAGAITLKNDKIVFEGGTGGGTNYTELKVTDPTAPRAVTLPNASGTVALTSDLTGGTVTSVTVAATAGTPYSSTTTPSFTIAGSGIASSSISSSTVTVNVPTQTLDVVTTAGSNTSNAFSSNSTVTGGGAFGAASSTSIESGGLLFEGSSADANETLLTPVNATAARTIYLPNASGTIPVPATEGTTGQVLTSAGTGAAPTWGTAGSGTVTSVSVTTANGVSGTVATATTTPAISLTLGAITPSSVASTGAVSGTTLTASSTSTLQDTVTLGTTTAGTANLTTAATGNEYMSFSAIGSAGNTATYDYNSADGNTGAGALAGSGVASIYWGKGKRISSSAPTNYEAGYFYMSGGDWTFVTESGGTGTARNIAMQPASGKDVLSTGGFLSSSATRGVGYTTGAGGAVTQATSKSTGVILNTMCGQITMNNATLNAGTVVSFTFSNSNLTSGKDVVATTIASAATAGAYVVYVDATGGGSCRVSVRNLSASNLSEAIVINFAIIRAATS